MDNYKSATNPVNRPMVEQTIRQEIALGNYVVSPTKPRIISALGAIPKPNSPEIRLIHDCSRPHRQAVNNYITTNLFKLQTLDDATTLLGPNYYMAKIDLQHAYRSVPIHPDNYKATECKWQFLGDHSYTYFYDTHLPFGAKSSLEIFHCITQSVRCMMARRGFPNIIVYLDDFLVIGATREECQLAHCVLDTMAGTTTLPADKLAELHTIILEFQNKQRASKKQLQRLAGKLNWACRVVCGSRTFLCRILDTMNALSSTGKFRLDSSFRNDIAWWVNFLRVFNGTRMFLGQLATVDVSTDACPVAAGGYFRGDWFYHHFSLDSPEWQNLHINHKETLAIVLTAQHWGQLWSHQCVVIHSDNQAAVQIINKGIITSPVVMNALRTLFWLSALYNFHITAVYLAGTDNALADSILCMHKTTSLHNFYTFLCSKFSTVSANSIPLAAHMSVYSVNYLFFQVHGMLP